MIAENSKMPALLNDQSRLAFWKENFRKALIDARNSETKNNEFRLECQNIKDLFGKFKVSWSEEQIVVKQILPEMKKKKKILIPFPETKTIPNYLKFTDALNNLEVNPTINPGIYNATLIRSQELMYYLETFWSVIRNYKEKRPDKDNCYATAKTFRTKINESIGELEFDLAEFNSGSSDVGLVDFYEKKLRLLMADIGVGGGGDFDETAVTEYFAKLLENSSLDLEALLGTKEEILLDGEFDLSTKLGIDIDRGGFSESLNRNLGLPLPSSPNVSVNLPNIGLSLPTLPDVSMNLPNIGSSSPSSPNASVKPPNIGVSSPSLPDVSVNLPNIGVSLPSLPDVSVNLPNIGVTLPTLPNVSVNLPNIGVSLPSLPDVSVNLPNIGLSLPSLPNVSANLPNIGPSLGGEVKPPSLHLPKVSLDHTSNTSSQESPMRETNVSRDRDTIGESPVSNNNSPNVPMVNETTLTQPNPTSGSLIPSSNNSPVDTAPLSSNKHTKIEDIRETITKTAKKLNSADDSSQSVRKVMEETAVPGQQTVLNSDHDWVQEGELREVNTNSSNDTKMGKDFVRYSTLNQETIGLANSNNQQLFGSTLPNLLFDTKSSGISNEINRSKPFVKHLRDDLKTMAKTEFNNGMENFSVIQDGILKKDFQGLITAGEKQVFNQEPLKQIKQNLKSSFVENIITPNILEISSGIPILKSYRQKINGIWIDIKSAGIFNEINRSKSIVKHLKDDLKTMAESEFNNGMENFSVIKDDILEKDFHGLITADEKKVFNQEPLKQIKQNLKSSFVENIIKPNVLEYSCGIPILKSYRQKINGKWINMFPRSGKQVSDYVKSIPKKVIANAGNLEKHIKKSIMETERTTVKKIGAAVTNSIGNQYRLMNGYEGHNSHSDLPVRLIRYLKQEDDGTLVAQKIDTKVPSQKTNYAVEHQLHNSDASTSWTKKEKSVGGILSQLQHSHESG